MQGWEDLQGRGAAHSHSQSLIPISGTASSAQTNGERSPLFRPHKRHVLLSSSNPPHLQPQLTLSPAPLHKLVSPGPRQGPAKPRTRPS